MFRFVFDLLFQPEYIALAISLLAVFVSIVAISANVYIAWRNRKYALAQTEYFKLRQIAENIISKLIFLDNHREKLKIFFELSYKTSTNENSIFLDLNDTFNKTNFEKNIEETAAFIDIYFSNLGGNWNNCLDEMTQLFNLVFILNKNIEQDSVINWNNEAVNFNKINLKLGDKPKKIADQIKWELEKFKKSNL